MKSKMEIAKEEFAKCNGDRRAFINAMLANGMTKNGASTYYQNIAMEQRGNVSAVGQIVGRAIRNPPAPMGQPTPIAPQPISTSATPIFTVPALNEPRPLVLVIEAAEFATGPFKSGKVVTDTLNQVLVNNAKLLSASASPDGNVRPNVLVVEIDAEITMGAFKAGRQAVENLNRMLGDGTTKLLSASEKY